VTRRFRQKVAADLTKVAPFVALLSPFHCRSLKMPKSSPFCRPQKHVLLHKITNFKHKNDNLKTISSNFTKYLTILSLTQNRPFCRLKKGRFSLFLKPPLISFCRPFGDKSPHLVTLAWMSLAR